MILSLIVAMSENRVIGREQQLPWSIPEDLKRLRAMTKGHPIVMGRKTFESIGRVLPDRTNIIVTRNPKYKVDGAVVVESVDKALEPYKNSNEEVFIFGGGEIFKQVVHKADRLYLTLVRQEVEGDTFFPQFSTDAFELTFREDHNEAPIPFSFLDYKRK
jgi:dihydrofolate reductase